MSQQDEILSPSVATEDPETDDFLVPLFSRPTTLKVVSPRKARTRKTSRHEGPSVYVDERKLLM